MKKILALFLLLAMLVPMCVVASAEEVADKPFYLVNMAQVDAVELSNVYDMPVFFALPVKEEDPILKVTYGETGAEQYKYVENFPKKAAALKEEFADQPEGTRYIFMEAQRAVFRACVEDGVYMEKGVAIFKEWLDSFLKEYKAIGGELDGLVIDFEYDAAKNWFIYEWLFKEDEYIYAKIVNNPNYQTLIRPQLAERGFKFYENTTDIKSELYSLHPNSGAEYAQSRDIWNNVIRGVMNEYVNQACEPLFTYYPDAVLTDWTSKNTYSWLKQVERGGGGFSDSGNIVHTVGNRVSEYTYSHRPSIPLFFKDGKTYTNVVGYNNSIYENTPYNGFLMDANLFKTSSAAAKDGKASYWIADWQHNKDNPNSASKTPYYTETVIHMAMLDPDPFCGYIIPIEIAEVNNPEDPDYTYALEVADDIMKELTRVLGKADRKPIPTNVDWNSKFYVSGMYAGGKNYWRVTPDTTVVSLENFKVEGTDPTFSAAGKTITFPGGKIIADGNVREVGTCGYWVETAADVSPVITVEDNYYYNYPAFAEKFDQYASGVALEAQTAQPAGVWETVKSDNSSGIVQDGALAIKGDFTATNVKLPQNINAVDVYAKHQAWEVEVTVPADMAADAEIVLLSCVDKDGNAGDVGVKIAGSKVYYDKAGQYAELSGVTVTPGSKYTVKRKLDMTAAGAFTSDYYIFDATGALLGSAEDIPMIAMTAPITSISLGCKKVAGAPVILDNYRLYLTDINTNFELYDAAHGMLVQDITAARDRDTAYRLSWVNAASEAKYYAVVAAYYNGDTLASEQVVRTFKVAPNTDGVVTGIVKNENAGQTLRVYWKETEAPAEPDKMPEGNAPVVPDTDGNTPVTPGGDGNAPSTPADSGNNPSPTVGDGNGSDVTKDKKSNKLVWLIVVAIVVVLAVAGEVVYVVISMKKKMKKTTEQTPEADEPSEE